MYTFVRSSLLALGALGFFLGASDPVQAKTWSLEECVRSALEHNVAIAQRTQELKNSEADLTRARSAFLPTVTAGGSWTKSEVGVGEFQNGVVRFFDESWSARLDASYTVFDGWGNVSGYQQASRARTSSRSSFRDSQQQVAYQTEVRFFEVAKQAALLEVQVEAVRQSAEQLKKTTAMKDLGAATQADVLKASVDHSNNRLAELRTERDWKVAKASLAEYIGLDPREELEIDASGVTDAVPLSLTEASARALDVNPELQAARQLVDSRASGVTSAKSERYPSFSFFYNTSYRNFEPNDLVFDWNYGVSMNLTIFDGLRTKANIRSAQAQKLLAEKSRESTERQVLLAVRQASLDLEIADQSITVSEEAVRSSEEDLRLAQERYKIGEGTILDVIDAQVNLTRSRTDLVNATYDRRLAVSALRDAVGDIPVPESRR